MKKTIVFLQNGSVNMFADKKTTPLVSTAAESYIQKTREIQSKNQWKTGGHGARFTGVSLSGMSSQETEFSLSILGLAKINPQKIIYTLNFENVGGIYTKDLETPQYQDQYVIVSNQFRFYEIDVNQKGEMVASCTNSSFERHLAILHPNNTDVKVITEGDCKDQNPKWSKTNENIIYYDSCGLGYDNSQHFVGFSPRSVFRLNLSNGELDEILSHEHFDCYAPQEDQNGNLYFLKRPYHLTHSKPMSFSEILTIPFKILKAIFGWLNFFTQRYSGDSLTTKGNNPAKSTQKSPKEMFIDGNLLDVEKNLKNNAANGEQNPGTIPSTWQLFVKKPNGEEILIKKGVLDYCLLPDQTLLYSNGKQIIHLTQNSNQTVICEANIASKLFPL